MSTFAELTTLVRALSDVNAALAKAEAAASHAPAGPAVERSLAVCKHIEELRAFISGEIICAASGVARKVASHVTHLPPRPWHVVPSGDGWWFVGPGSCSAGRFSESGTARALVDVINDVDALLLAVEALRGAS